MVNSPAASEAPLSEVGGPAPSDVTWNYIDSVSAVGMPEPQAAFPAGFQQYNHYQPLQMGGSDPNALQLSHVIWELQQQQQMNVQLMQQMTMVQQHVFGHGQQSSASPQVAPRRSRNNKAPRPWMEERKRRKQAQSAAAASQAGQGFAGGSIGATEPQCKSDADEVEPEGALKKMTEEMEEHRKQFEHLSKEMATKEWVNEQLGQLERDATANMEAIAEKMATKTELQEMATKMEEVSEQLGQLQRDATANMELISATMAAKIEVQEERMATTERVNEQLVAAVEMEKMRVASRELVEQLNRDKDKLAAEFADVQDSIQKNHAETADEILQMKTSNDAHYEQLSKQTSELKHTVAQLTDEQGAAQAAVQDVTDEVKALKRRMEEMQTKALKSIHAFDVFAHLLPGTSTICGNVRQYQITVNLVRGSDAVILASALAPCMLCCENGKWWVDNTELRQCVTGLLASHMAAGGQRWAYMAYARIDNLSYIHPFGLHKREPLPPGSCDSPQYSVEWLQVWLRRSPVVPITDADVNVAVEAKALKESMEEMQAKALKSMATKEEFDEQFHQLKLDKDATIERLSAVTGTLDAAVKDAVSAAMKDGPEQELERVKASTSELKHTFAQLTDGQGATQAAVQDVTDEVKALKERMEEMQTKALKSVATREEVEKQFRQLKRDKDATIERLSSVTGALDAAVKDAVSAAMQEGPERELERVKASLKELSSPQGTALLQSPPRTNVIHAFDIFAHLQFGCPTECGNVFQRPITVTLVRGSDASSLASAVAPCKLCAENGEQWVDDPQAVCQCVTRLLANHGATGGQQRWAYVAYCVSSNLSCVRSQDLLKKKPLPPGICDSLHVNSVEWFQAWLRSCSPDLAITDADVRAHDKSY